MEHIVQLGISIDDGAIAASIVREASRRLESEMRRAVLDALPKTFGDPDWRRVAEDAAAALMAEHRDEIIEAAASKIAASTVRSKAWRERR